VSGLLSEEDMAEIEKIAGNAPNKFWVH
jgi:hypothetical protein